MIYTVKIRKAIDLARACHYRQLRRDGSHYIIHPLTVGLILARVSNDEDIICVGILHDVVEESNYELSKIGDVFGVKVKNIVDDLSEDMTLPWKVRKERVLKMLDNADKDIILVKSADFLSNLVDYLYLTNGERKLLSGFSTDYKLRLEHWEKLYKKLNEKWPKNPLIKEISDTIELVIKTEEVKVHLE